MITKDKKFLKFAAGIFGVSLATLTYEVALSYVFAFMFWFNASIAILSVAMFGLGMGGVFGYFLNKMAPKRYFDILYCSVLAFGVALFVSLFLIAKGSMWEIKEPFSLVYFSISAAIPFVFSGIALSTGLNYPSRDKRVISYIYFSDLVGAGIGSFFITLLLPFLSVEGVIVLCSIIALASSVLFSRNSGIGKTYPPLFVALILLTYMVFPSSFVPEPAGNKFLSKLKADGAKVLYTEWNSVSRVDVVEYADQPRIFFIENGLSPVEVSHGNVDSSSLIKDPRYFMFFKNPKNMLAIGSGGGVELTMALRAGVEKIDAVEINPFIIKYMKNDLETYSNRLYYNPKITTIIEDGRTFVHRVDRKYDLIENGVVGSAGLVVPSSRVLNFQFAYVYTKEANVDYWNHLSEDGVTLTIIYVLLDEYNAVDVDNGVSYHLLRQYFTVKSALEELNVDPSKHMMMFLFHPSTEKPQIDAYQGEYTFIFKKELTPAYVEEIIQKAGEYGLKPVYAPYYEGSLEFEKFAGEIPDWRSISPVNDDKPFFYHTEISAPKDLWNMLYLLAGLTLVFMIFPIVIERRFKTEHKSSYLLLVYFFCLGMAYIMVEAVLIQKLTLFLGRPAYAFQVVLFSMLLFSGVGSFLTGLTVLDKKVPKAVSSLLLFTSLAVFAYAFLTSHVIYGYMGRGIFQKVLISVAFLIPLATLMGTPFPLGLRITSRIAERDVIWMYGLNGAGAVLGSLVGMIIAFNRGYSYSLFMGGIIYLVAFIAMLSVLKSFNWF